MMVYQRKGKQDVVVWKSRKFYDSALEQKTGFGYTERKQIFESLVKVEEV